MRPIGVFDSGVGGLTVLKALRQKLPWQDFVYFSDTARVPYGRKPKEMVRGFATEIAHFLQQLDVSGIVIACNTASAVASADLARDLSIPVWGVIDRGLRRRGAPPGAATSASLARKGRLPARCTS